MDAIRRRIWTSLFCTTPSRTVRTVCPNLSDWSVSDWTTSIGLMQSTRSDFELPPRLSESR
jgi:hypothetical protein